jgi:hypothetical protein
VPSPPDVAVSFGKTHPGNLGEGVDDTLSDTRTLSTGPPASALTTRPPNSTVTVVFGSATGGGGGAGAVNFPPSHPTLATMHAQTAMRPRCRHIFQLSVLSACR